MLPVLDSLPPGLFEGPTTSVYRRLTGPTLIYIEGERPEPLMLAALMHGNETSAWPALRELFGSGERPGRSVVLFIGNVAAAREGARMLDGQPDYNRIWRAGTHSGGMPEFAMAQDLLQRLSACPPVASVDLHNTTGRNPHHAAVASRDALTLALARRFSPHTILMEQPDTTFSHALSALCPSFTLECGQPGDEAGIAEAVAFVRELLDADSLRSLASGSLEPRPSDGALYRTMATVTAAPDLSIAFSDTDLDDAAADLRFVPGIDRLNFSDVRAGEAFATVRDGVTTLLEVHDGSGGDVAERYFRLAGDKLVARVPLFPAMLTTDARIVRQDCFCYLMERL